MMSGETNEHPTKADIERAAWRLTKWLYPAVDRTVGTNDGMVCAAICILTDHYAALAERGAQVMEWRPISEAPMDGTIIDVWLGNADDDDLEFFCIRGTRRAPGWAWIYGKWRPTLNGLQMPAFIQPTHFVLPPAPPKGENP